MGGVRAFDIRGLTNQRDIGIMVPVPLKHEWYIKMKEINDILDIHGIRSEPQLVGYLKILHCKGEILGGLELPLGVAMSILETNTTKDFPVINDLIRKYNAFIKVFTDGNYTKLELIIRHVPGIIFGLISLI